jgi:energy coupling factor transporter S component ThiW
MQDWILNIILGGVFCGFLVLLSVLVVLIWTTSNENGFDHRILFALYLFFQGIFVLLSSFDLSFLGQKMQHIFIQGSANALLIAITVLILMDGKYLIASFIAGTAFIMEGAFVMISGSVQDLQLISGIFSAAAALFFIITLFYLLYSKKPFLRYFRSGMVIIGVSLVSCSNGIRQVLLEYGFYWGALLLLMVGATVVFLSIVYYQQEIHAQNQNRSHSLALRVSMTAILTALGVVLSFFNPLGYIPLGGFLINPFAHLINAIAGVFLGPLWAIISASFIAIIRYSAGIGTIFAFPGGIPGAMVVGIVAVIFSAIKKGKYRIYAAFCEVIGTVGIGAVISYAFMGIPSSIFLWVGWSISSILGSSIGFLILWILEKRNISFENFGEPIIV